MTTGAGVPVLFVPFKGLPVPDNMALLKRKREVGLEQRGTQQVPGRSCGEGVAEAPERAPRVRREREGGPLARAGTAEGDHEPDDVEEDEREPPPPGVIATLVYVARYGIGCDVLVRATGCTGYLGWGPHSGRQWEDRHHAGARYRRL